MDDESGSYDTYKIAKNKTFTSKKKSFTWTIPLKVVVKDTSEMLTEKDFPTVTIVKSKSELKAKAVDFEKYLPKTKLFIFSSKVQVKDTSVVKAVVNHRTVGTQTVYNSPYPHTYVKEKGAVIEGYLELDACGYGETEVTISGCQLYPEFKMFSITFKVKVVSPEEV